MKKKKVVSTVLAAAMSLSLLAGCGSNAGTQSSAEEKDNTQTKASVEKTEEAEASSQAAVEDMGEPYELYMNFPTFGTTPSGLEDVEAYVSELCKEQGVNIDLVLQPCMVFNLESENNLTISAGDKIDLVMTLWAGGFGNYIQKDAIIPIGDLAEQYAKETLELMGDRIAGGYYNGELYAFPVVGELNAAGGYNIRKDLLEEYCAETGFVYDRETIYTLEDLDTMLEWIHTKYPEMHLFAGTGSTTDNFQWLANYDNLGTGTYVTGVLPLDGSKSTEVLNVYETDEFMNYAKTMYEWNKKGYFSSGDATNEDSADIQIPTGDYAGWLSTIYTTDYDASSYGYDLAAIKLWGGNMTTSFLSDIAWAVSSTCENPTAAIQFLNLMYTDTRISTALKIGLEGVTYEVVDRADDGYIQYQFVDGLNAETAPYYTAFGVWGMATLTPETDTVEVHENAIGQDAIALANTEKNVVALGYRFDYTPYATEVAAMQSVMNKYVGVISYGTADPEKTVEALRQELKTAGIDEVIEANQKALDEWLAEQK